MRPHGSQKRGARPGAKPWRAGPGPQRKGAAGPARKFAPGGKRRFAAKSKRGGAPVAKRRAAPASGHGTRSAQLPALVRINRFLSMCGVTSRRKAEELVTLGKVEVNGEVVRDLATRVNPSHDRVLVSGSQVLPVSGFLYLVLNKPKDSITTLSDERGRTTVMSMIRTNERVYPVGRLDRNTTGVLLLTNDGEFAHRLMHPKFNVPKSYLVSCDRALAYADMARLRSGIDLDDGRTSPADVLLIPRGHGKEVGITIHEGRNRQVRRMFEKLGYEVVKLDRVAYGPVTKEGLARGGTRSLTRSEVRSLKLMAGYTEEELLSGR